MHVGINFLLELLTHFFVCWIKLESALGNTKTETRHHLVNMEKSNSTTSEKKEKNNNVIATQPIFRPLGRDFSSDESSLSRNQAILPLGREFSSQEESSGCSLDGDILEAPHACGNSDYIIMQRNKAFQSHFLGEYNYEPDNGDDVEDLSSDENGDKEGYEEMEYHTGKRARVHDGKLPSRVQGTGPMELPLPFSGDYTLDDEDVSYVSDIDDYYFNNDDYGDENHGYTSNDSCSSSNDNPYFIGGESPMRKRTHIENEQSHQQNLFLLLPEVHRDIIRLESMRIKSSTGHKCEGCNFTNPSRLWRCKECSIMRYSSKMLCDECAVNRHISNPHCMEVMCQGDNVFRKPFSHETLTFRLNIQFC